MTESKKQLFEVMILLKTNSKMSSKEVEEEITHLLKDSFERGSVKVI